MLLKWLHWILDYQPKTRVLTVVEKNSDGLFCYSWPIKEGSNSCQTLLMVDDYEVDKNIDIDSFLVALKNVPPILESDPQDFSVRVDSNKLITVRVF